MPEQIPEKTNDQKQKQTAGILALVLGSLGVHNIYLGAPAAGVVQFMATIFTASLAIAVPPLKDAFLVLAIGHPLLEAGCLLTMKKETFDSLYNDSKPRWMDFVLLRTRLKPEQLESPPPVFRLRTKLIMAASCAGVLFILSSIVYFMMSRVETGNELFAKGQQKEAVELYLFYEQAALRDATAAPNLMTYLVETKNKKGLSQVAKTVIKYKMDLPRRPVYEKQLLAAISKEKAAIVSRKKAEEAAKKAKAAADELAMEEWTIKRDRRQAAEQMKENMKEYAKGRTMSTREALGYFDTMQKIDRSIEENQ